MDFLRTWAIVGKYRILIVSLVVTAVLASLVVLYFVPPTYTATAKVLLAPSEASLLVARVGGVAIPTTIDPGRTLSQTYTEIIATREVAARIAAAIAMEIPDPAPPEGLDLLREWTAKSLQWVVYMVQYGEYKEPTREQATVEGIQRSLSVQQVRESFVLLINSHTANPYLSALIANQAARAFVQYGRELAVQESRAQRQFLEGRLEKAGPRLEAARAALLKFRQEEGQVSLDLETQLRVTNLVNAQREMDALNGRISEEQARQKETQEQLAEQETEATEKTRTKTGSTTTDSQSQRTTGQSAGQGVDESLQTSLSETVTTTATQETTGANPIYRSLNAEALAQERNLAGLYSRKWVLSNEISRMRTALKDTPQRQARLAELTLELGLAEDLYTKLQGQLEDALAAEARQVEPVRLIEEARAPDYPRSPIRILYVSVALVAALLIGLMVAFLSENIADLRRRRQEPSPPEANP